jgi:hypothetical protein
MRCCCPLSRLRRPGAWLAVALAVVSSLPACSLFSSGPDNVFYISSAGSNSAAGTSPSTAWRTLSRADSARFRPGDRLLLRGGDRFAGQLRFGPHDAGNPRKPVTIGSYGHGHATIIGSARSAIVVVDTAGVDIGSLTLVGRRASGSGSAGIQLYSDRPAGHRLRHVVIRNVDASGFETGISMGALNPGAGFAHVRISHSALHGNLDAGLASYGPRFNPAAPSYAHADIRIDHVSAIGNLGNPASTRSNTGNGIALGSVSDAQVTWSTAAHNGGANASPYEGPIGIWAYDSAGVVMQHDVSYDNRTASRRDGGGFGLDENTSGSYLQYDLAYGNDGAGFQVYSPNGATNTGNVVRYDISSGDALRTINASGIIVAGRVTGAAVYQNTVIMGPQAGGIPHSALWLGKIRRVTVRNNLFVVDHVGPIIISLHHVARSAALLQGNDYFSAAHRWQVLWGLGSSYGTLRAWRQATGQESVGGRPAGLAVNPRLAGPVVGQASTSAADPGSGVGFIPADGSPLVGAGLDLRRLFHMDPGSVTFSGRPVRSRTPNIGAS